jgi:hypothetical protein
VFKLLAALVIFRRDSDSLFVVEDVAFVVVGGGGGGGVLPFAGLVSLEFAAKKKDLI